MSRKVYGVGSPSRISTISIDRRTRGASASMLASIVPRMLAKVGSSRRGAVAPFATSLCVGALCHRRAASVTWDGYVSYDGVLYGLPGVLALAGKCVQVRERKGTLSVWSAGAQVFEIAKRPRSQDSVPHAEQWKTVASVSAVRHGPTPLGHLQSVP